MKESFVEFSKDSFIACGVFMVDVVMAIILNSYRLCENWYIIRLEDWRECLRHLCKCSFSYVILQGPPPRGGENK